MQGEVAIELFGFDETSAAYIQARFEAIRGADNGKGPGGSVETWAIYLVDVAHANLNRMFNFFKIVFRPQRRIIMFVLR